MEHDELRKVFSSLPYRCVKGSTYFPVYVDLVRAFRGRQITLVEVGILEGGSLHFWRRVLGEEARIIGIDINAGAKILEEDGFEIYIGSQSDEKFWAEFYTQVGEIDVLIDDGGHTFEQQIKTVRCSLPFINDGGRILVEDVCTSFMSEYGGPSRYSFFEFCVMLCKKIARRNHNLLGQAANFSREIWSIAFYESIVEFRIDRSLAAIESVELENTAAPRSADYFQYGQERTSIEKRVGQFARKLPRGSAAHKVLLLARRIQKTFSATFARKQNLRRYFKE
jgi:hypothetical protein